MTKLYSDLYKTCMTCGKEKLATDFYVRNKPMNADKGKVGIQLRSEFENNIVTYKVDVSGSPNASQNRQLIVNLPDGLEYLVGSATIDGNKTDVARTEQQQLVFDIGKWTSEDWRSSVSFSAKSNIRIEGEYTTTAQLRFQTSDNEAQHSSRVFNTLLHQAKTVERPIFESSYQNKRQIDLSDADRADLDSVIDYLLDKRIRKLRIVSHTDSEPVPPDLVNLYKDNKKM